MKRAEKLLKVMEQFAFYTHVRGPREASAEACKIIRVLHTKGKEAPEPEFVALAMPFLRAQLRRDKKVVPGVFFNGILRGRR